MLLWLILSAQAAPAAAAAPPAATIEVLVAKQGASDDRWCTQDEKWCASVAGGSDVPPTLKIEDNRQIRVLSPPPGDQNMGGAEEPASYSLWPAHIHLGAGGGDIVGLIRHYQTMYSGGGAHGAMLTLYRVAPHKGLDPVLSIPWQSEIMIRACFNDEDFEHRASACHDEYEFSASLTILAAQAGTPPDLRYQAVATSYPGHVSRHADSLAGRALRERDLVRVHNGKCTFSRRFRFDLTTQHYKPDRALPECPDYWEL